MKTFVLSIMILTLMSCYNGKPSNEIKEAIIQNEVYRSTDASFQKDFYISIENRKWEKGYQTTHLNS
jgi:hypothetical protein